MSVKYFSYLRQSFYIHTNDQEYMIDFQRNGTNIGSVYSDSLYLFLQSKNTKNHSILSAIILTAI